MINKGFTGYGDSYHDIDITIQLNNLLIKVFYITFEPGAPDRKHLNFVSKCHDLHYIPQGRGVFRVGDECIDASPDCFYLFPPDVCYSKISDSEDPMHEYHIQFAVDILPRRHDGKYHLFVQNEVDSIISMLSTKNHSWMDDQFREDTVETFRRIRVELEEQRVGYYMSLYSLFVDIFIKASRCFSKQQKAYYHVPLQVDGDKRKRLLDLLFYDDYKTLTLKKIAGLLRISERQAERIVIRYYSLPFKEMLTQVRLEKSKELLARPEMSVDAISKAVGFKGASYFHELFKKHNNMTPGEFRRIYKDKV